MSTIKSSTEHLTLNADGSGKEIRLQNDGTQNVVLDSSGNVGIGTSSPDGTLHLDAGTSSDLVIEKDSAGGAAVRFHNAGSQVSYIQLDASEDMIHYGGSGVNQIIYAGGYERLRIDSSGNVGIGTSSPSQELDISSANPAVRLTDTSTSGLYHEVVSYGNDLRFSADGGNVEGSTNIEFFIDGDEKMRIESNGRIHTNGTVNRTGALNLVGEKGNSYRAVVFEHTNNGGEVGTIITSSSSTAYNTSSDYRLKENVVPMTDSIDRLKLLNPSRFNFIKDADTTVDGFLAHEAQEVVPEAVTGEKDAMTTEEYEVTPAQYETITIPAVEEELDEDGNVVVEAQEERTEEQLVTEAVMGEREVEDYQGIDQSKLVPLLVGALQEAVARIEQLENA